MMDKTVAGLLGAVGALVASSSGQAAPQPPAAQAVLQAQSYAELLRPVPNAVATLRALDDADVQPQVELVQLGPAVRDLLGERRGYDHHHHHHRYDRRVIRHHHHHHHHHHNDYYRNDYYRR